MGKKYNYILAMYYIHNKNELGEQKAIVYANKYINRIQLGCKYSDQDEVDKMCPEFIKNVNIVPDFFSDIFATI